MWNLLHQYNNIYASLYKYLREKKKAQIDDWRKKKKKIYIYIYIYTVATVSIEQTKRHYSYCSNTNLI